MAKEKIATIPLQANWSRKAKAFSQLLKFRLSMLVAVSAVFGYAMAADGGASWGLLAWMGIGGLLITGAANGLNQLFEREYDGLMERTKSRPLPQKALSNGEALIFSLLIGALGVGLIGYLFNLAAALLGIIGLLSYAFVYTPLKRITPFAVFVGAIPGALPPLIGWAGFTGALGTEGWLLFIFQFFWQFPHFWAIAWLADEDYQKAGFKMLPSPGGKTQSSARLMLVYAICLIPLAYFPWQQEMLNGLQAIGLAVLGLAFAVPAFRLWKGLDRKFARQLMFASFLYLPLMELVFLWGR
ncbi:MAG: heme o synthase [Bacteroidota bacterium]